MIPKNLLGRYEFTDWSKNSNKFWHIIFNTSKNEYVVHYGRIGNKGVMHKYNETQALKKIKDKIRKGYKKNTSGNYQEIVGTQSIDFIKNILGAD